MPFSYGCHKSENEFKMWLAISLQLITSSGWRPKAFRNHITSISWETILWLFRAMCVFGNAQRWKEEIYISDSSPLRHLTDDSCVHHHSHTHAHTRIHTVISHLFSATQLPSALVETEPSLTRLDQSVFWDEYAQLWDIKLTIIE